MPIEQTYGRSIWNRNIQGNPDRIYYVSKGGNDSDEGELSNPFLTVAVGLAALSDGDALVIGAGEYDEVGMTLTNARCQVVSAGGMNSVYLTDSVGGNPDFSITGADTTITGLRIGTTGSTFGVATAAARVTFNNCWFQNAAVGVQITLTHCQVNDCLFTAAGATIGLQIINTSDLRVNRCLFIGDGATSTVGINVLSSDFVVGVLNSVSGFISGITFNATADNNFFYQMGFANNTTNWTDVAGGTANVLIGEEQSLITANNTLQQDLQALHESQPVYIATVTNRNAATSFDCAALTGFGDDYFNDWWVYVEWDAGGASAAPQGEWKLITDYDESDRRITIPADFSAVIAAGDIVRLVHPTLRAAMLIQGGSKTIQDLWDWQQSNLDMARSAQSGDFLCDGATNTIYEESSTTPFEFNGASIDFTAANAGAGEDTTIQIDVKVESGGAWVNRWTSPPAGVGSILNAGLPVPVVMEIPNSAYGIQLDLPIRNVYGIRITETQAMEGGDWNTLVLEVFDSK